MYNKMSFPAPPDAKDSRVWIDGCFDFAHHGHAGAMLQARQLGKELYVGVHSDEEILKNKGPTVMTLPERLVAVEACKWCTRPVPDAPYVTDPDFLDKFQCKYAVHGDDITTDANGEDCYKIVKDLGRFIVVKRTPSISTTDLVGRMLLYTKTHHLKSITLDDYSDYVNGAPELHPLLQPESLERYRLYATDLTGHRPGNSVLVHTASSSKIHTLVESSANMIDKAARGGIYYISGTFDLFHPGHIELLKEIRRRADSQNPPAAVVVGILDDHTANSHKGLNYPIMSLFERSLCVLQCRYVDSIVLGAPYINSQDYFGLLKNTLHGDVKKVFHGSTVELVFENQSGTKVETADPFQYERKAGIYEHIGSHLYDDVTTEVIVSRVLDHRKEYEERQRKKGWKSEKELKMEAEEKAGKK